MPSSPILNVVQQQKRDALFIKQMLETDGWQVIETEMNQKVQDLTRSLISETDSDAVRLLQMEILAIQALMSAIVAKASVQTD